MGMARDPHIADVLHRVIDATAHGEQIAGALTREQLLWRPSPKAWSIGECYEHIIMAADLYYGVIGRALDEAEGPVEGNIPAWKPRLGGRFLMKGLTSRRRLKTLKIFKPLEVRQDVVHDFVRAQNELIALLRRADGYDLNKIRFRSPATRLVRLNLGDAFVILALHAQRHLRQAQRVLDTPEFPGTTSESSD